MTMINHTARERELLPLPEIAVAPPLLRAHACARETRQTAEGAIPLVARRRAHPFGREPWLSNC